jgi:hypothetical protein
MGNRNRDTVNKRNILFPSVYRKASPSNCGSKDDNDESRCNKERLNGNFYNEHRISFYVDFFGFTLLNRSTGLTLLDVFLMGIC